MSFKIYYSITSSHFKLLFLLLSLIKINYNSVNCVEEAGATNIQSSHQINLFPVKSKFLHKSNNNHNNNNVYNYLPQGNSYRINSNNAGYPTTSSSFKTGIESISNQLISVSLLASVLMTGLLFTLQFNNGKHSNLHQIQPNGYQWDGLKDENLDSEESSESKEYYHHKSQRMFTKLKFPRTIIGVVGQSINLGAGSTRVTSALIGLSNAIRRVINRLRQSTTPSVPGPGSAEQDGSQSDSSQQQQQNDPGSSDGTPAAGGATTDAKNNTTILIAELLQNPNQVVNLEKLSSAQQKRLLQELLVLDDEVQAMRKHLEANPGTKLGGLGGVLSNNNNKVGGLGTLGALGGLNSILSYFNDEDYDNDTEEEFDYDNDYDNVGNGKV